MRRRYEGLVADLRWRKDHQAGAIETVLMRDDLVIGEAEIYDALRRVLDPEIGVNVVDLGLVYGVTIDGDDVRVDLTMTTPACPLGDTLVRETETVLRDAGVAGRVDVNVVWDPPWNPEMMSSAARDQLGWAASSSSA